MQKTSPIQNNQNVLPLRPTMPNPLDFTNQLQVYNYDVPHKLTGYVSPTGVGNFSILDAEGNLLFLPAVSMVTAVGLVATGPVVPAAGSLTMSVGATAVTGAITSSGANTGYLAAPRLLYLLRPLLDSQPAHHFWSMSFTLSWPKSVYV